MNKRLLFLLTPLLLLCGVATAQNIGINATGAAPDVSAGLDINFTNKGLLIPNVALTSTASNSPIGASVATSLLVYNTATINDVTPGYYYWDGTSWVRLLNAGGTSNDWSITGNSGTTAGTNFIGTTDAIDWVIKTNNTERARVTAGGNVGVGTATPSNKVHIYEATNNASRSLLYSESNDPGSGGTISNVAIMGKAVGTGNATDKYVGVLGYTDGGGYGCWRAHGVMGVVGDNSAADWTTYNPYDAPVNATAAGITGYSTGNIIVQNTAGYFLNDGTGFSTHKGVQIQNYATNATRYGIYMEVENTTGTTSSRQYGIRMDVNESTNESYGTYLNIDGNTNSDNWGDYIDVTGTGTGTSYGSQVFLSGGATNYGAKYSVSSGTNSYGVYAQTTGGTNEYGIYADASSSTDYAGYFNDGKVYVKDQLTVGTTTPNEKLTVQGAISIDEASAPSATAGYGKLYVKSTTSDLYFKDDSGVEYNLLTSGTGPWTDGGTDVYLTTSTDQVGIGTSTPSESLELGGTNAKIYMNSGTSNMLYFNTAGIGAPTVSTRSAGTKTVLYPALSASTVDYAMGVENFTQWYSVPSATASYAHKFYAGTSEVFKIQGDGTVENGRGGAGFTYFDYNTQTRPDNTKGDFAISWNYNAGHRTVDLWNPHYAGGNMGYTFHQMTGASSHIDLMELRGNGDVYLNQVYSSTVGVTNRDLYIDNTGKVGYVSSSRRYKNNIKTMEDVSWLYQLNPVNYTYKTDNTNRKQYGLIAEEVEQVNDLLVSYNADGSVETVSYSVLITPMLKAIQDLQKEVETLKKENLKMSKQIKNNISKE